MSLTVPLFDSHAHLDDPGGDADALIRQLQALVAQGWTGALIPGYDPDRYLLARRLIQAVPPLVRAVGLHPEALAAMPDEAARERAWRLFLAELDQPGVVAVGEIGLDKRHKKTFSLPLQIGWFRRSLQVARERSLPIVLHLIGWHGHGLEVLQAHRPHRGVVHRWSGPLEMVKPYQDLGLHLALGLEPRESPVKRQAAAAAIAADRLLIETDWPFLGMTYPRALSEMGQLLETLAVWRGEPVDELGPRLAANAHAVYGSARL